MIYGNSYEGRSQPSLFSLARSLFGDMAALMSPFFDGRHQTNHGNSSLAPTCDDCDPSEARSMVSDSMNREGISDKVSF